MTFRDNFFQTFPDGENVFTDNSRRWYKNNVYHREDGPAVIFNESYYNVDFWYINGNNITRDVNFWIKENGYPTWENWDDAIKMHFKFTFV